MITLINTALFPIIFWVETQLKINLIEQTWWYPFQNDIMDFSDVNVMTQQFGIKACIWRNQVCIVIGLFGYLWYHVKSYLRFVFSILPLYDTERFTFPIRESAHNEFSSECLWVLVIPLKGKPGPLSLACVFPKYEYMECIFTFSN